MADTSVPTSQLVELIDEALALLATHQIEASITNDGDREPLPSLLEECEALLASEIEEAPVVRMIISLGPLETATRQLLQRQPNCALIDAADLAQLARNDSNSSAIGTQDQWQVIDQAFNELLRSHHRKGNRLILLHNMLQGNLGCWPSTNSSNGARELRGLVLTAHPLRTYLTARHQGMLPITLAPLEAFAAEAARFLSAHEGFQQIQLEAFADEPRQLLDFCSEALDLRARHPHAVGDSLVLDSPEPGVLTFADGAPAIEAPLDNRDYNDLCKRLGYQSDEFPGFTDASHSLAPPSLPPALTLPAIPDGWTPAYLGTFLPQIAQLLAAETDRFRLTVSALVAQIEQCLNQSGRLLEALDEATEALPVRDRTLFMITCAAHFQARGDRLQAENLLNRAGPLKDPADRRLQLLASEVHMRLGNVEAAMRWLVADALSGPATLTEASARKLLAALDQSLNKRVAEHGHSLLLDYLQKQLPPADLSRRKVMIEIGTTREDVSGQGSTEKLALRCAELGIDFITVDMDPQNTVMARRMFRRHGLPCEAVTARGEDFLAQWDGPIDYCFLDAYDFDHGNHTELRQSRYETFLGDRISDEACHKMHYECTLSLIAKLAPDGIVCFDDTWTDDAGRWTAKGTTAMPLLLDNGFKLLEARNRAALLIRG